MQQINLFALICTRSSDLKPVTKNLLSYLESVGVNVKLLVDKKSIFHAYSMGFNFIKEERPAPNDIVILCHDDIEILNSKEDFLLWLNWLSASRKVGFAGVAGTSTLASNAVWWDSEEWKKGSHRGYVQHAGKFANHWTYYGPPGKVAVLDGLFLAIKYEDLLGIQLNKPDYFVGNWDYYDIYYTSQAIMLGKENHVLPLFIRHESIGELAGKTGWESNRRAFIANNSLPLKI